MTGASDQRDDGCVCGHGRHDHSNAALWCINGKTTFPTVYPCACSRFRPAVARQDQGTDDGEMALCENCDGRECMDCVCRTVHDYCQRDCPSC